MDVLRLLPVLATAAWLVRGDAGGAVVLAVMAAAAWAVRPLRLPAPLDVAFLLVLCVGSAGELLGLYDDVAWFDTVVHVAVAMAAAPVAQLGLARLGAVPGPREAPAWAVALLTVVLGAALGCVWEIVEWAADGLLGSHLQESLADTNRDLLADVSGAAAGAALLVLTTRRG